MSSLLCSLREDTELKAAVENHGLQVKNLMKIQQSLLSVQKDFKSETQELQKAPRMYSSCEYACIVVAVGPRYTTFRRQRDMEFLL